MGKTIKYIINGILSTLILLIPFISNACTIFVLTDGTNTLFFNNEDYSNPNTNIWFIPAGSNYYGAAYVGFDNGWAQGGVNTEGLAFDWYAGGNGEYTPAKSLIHARQNSSQRMLETCATVEEAIHFYKTHAEVSFAEATIFIADKTGASVIIGAKNGKLFFEKSKQNAALGYGLSTFTKLHGNETPVHLEKGSEILKQCVQQGEYATKYSTIYDLRTGDIFINQFLNNIESTSLNLFSELEKGNHYYDIPQIKTQQVQLLKPLLLKQHRLCLYEFKDLSSQEPKITSKVRQSVLDATKGTLRSNYFDENFWAEIKSSQKEMQTDLQKMGALKLLYLVKKEYLKELTAYSYVLVYENARILMQFNFDNEQKIHAIETLTGEVTNAEVFRRDAKFNTNRFIPYGWIVIGIFIIGLSTFALIRRRNHSFTS